MSFAATAGIAAAAGFMALMVFEALLAFGAPWGRAAWGGAHVRLPAHLRLASTVAAGVYFFAALIVLGRAGYLGSGVFDGVFFWGTWVLAVAMALGTVLNLASSSKWERFLMSPIALVLAVLCLGSGSR